MSWIGRARLSGLRLGLARTSIVPCVARGRCTKASATWRISILCASNVARGFRSSAMRLRQAREAIALPPRQAPDTARQWLYGVRIVCLSLLGTNAAIVSIAMRAIGSLRLRRAARKSKVGSYSSLPNKQGIGKLPRIERTGLTMVSDPQGRMNERKGLQMSNNDKNNKASQQEEIERYERNAKLWKARKDRWNAWKRANGK
mgnify:CR=1 FL=1